MEEPNQLAEEPYIEPAQEIKTDPVKSADIITEGVTPIHNMGGGYLEYANALFQKDALKELRPDLFRLKTDDEFSSSSNFGTQFPRIAAKGDIFVRVDALPNRVFKFDGRKWIEQNKTTTDSYLYDQEYIKYLVDKIEKREYDVDLLSPQEEEQIKEYLKGNQNN